MDLYFIAKNQKRIDSNLRGLTVEQINYVLTKFEEYRDSRIEEDKRHAEEIAKKEALCQDVRSYMERLGLSKEDFAEFNSAEPTALKTKRKPATPKYQLEVSGEVILWSGAGRAPRLIADYIENGGNKEDLLINAA